MSDFDKFKSAIFGQESGNGAVDTSKPNYAGALGKGQILRPTFEGLKKQGKIPADYEWTNPAHNEEAAVAYMQEAWSAGGGRPDLAAAYYYGGPKAIKGGQIVSYRDLKNPNAPDTIGYANSVLKRMDGLPLPTARQVDNAIERKPSAAEYASAIEASIQNSVLRPGDRDAFQRRLEVEGEAAALQEQSRPTGFEQFGAAVASNTDSRLVRGIEKRIWGDEFEAVPGFKPDLKQLPQGATSDLIEDYATATSPKAAEKVLRLYNEEQERTKTLFDNGMATGLAISLAGELTSFSNVVPGMALARAYQLAGKGSLALAQAGRPGAAVGAAITENLVTGTAIEAIAQGLDGRFKPGDLALSFVADSIIGAAAGGLAVRAANIRGAEEAVERGVQEAVNREVAYAARAERELGPNADPDEMRRRMDSYPAEDAKKLVTDVIAPSSNSKLLGTDPAPVPEQAVAQTDIPEARANFDAPGALLSREKAFAPGGRFERSIADYSGGIAKTLDELHALPPGIHVAGTVPADVRPALDTMQRLVKQFLPDYRITLNSSPNASLKDGQKVNGSVAQVSERAAMIKVDGSMAQSQIIRTTVHELGHVVFNANISKLAPADKAKLIDALADFVRTSQVDRVGGNAARGKRYSLLNQSLRANKELTPPLTTPYEHSWDEFSAEQFVKYVERDVVTDNKLGLRRDVVSILRAAIQRALEFLRLAKRENIPVTNEYAALFDSILASKEGQAALSGRGALSQLDAPLEQAAVPASPTDVANEVLTDPDAVRYGLSLAPLDTPKARADAQAMLALHKRAEQWAAANPIDPARVDQLIAKGSFGGRFASTGLLMLKSPSPLVRMIASELLEDASGASGVRKPTAAISKYLTERLMLGNAINDVQSAYNFWKAAHGGSLKDDLIGGTKWTEFNKAVASEIEARRFSGALTQDPNIKGAADVLEAAYQRIANEQRKVGTNGSDALPTTSKGYMPHRMSPGAVLALSPAKRQVLHNALMDQFITIEGWDATFADRLAAKYIDRVRARGAGDYDTAIGGRGSASDVEEALRGMDLPEDVIANHMANFNKGSAGWTKARIELDLNRVYQTPEGEFRLMDIFETDQLTLLRAQAGRASGDVALTKFGVRGTEGLKLLRKAMQYGANGQMADNVEREAFEQIAKEFMNEPFGNQTGRWADRLMTANAVVRLGGVVFNQFAELANGFAHVGVAASLKHIPEFRRLRAEVIELSKGNRVNNSLLDSIEAGGAEFGADNYKVVLPFDNQNNLNPAYGQDTLTATDRLLRGAGHLQSKFSGWRAIHAVQERGMAEQIVLKMARYSQDGSSDAALRDMGITPELQLAIRNSGAARFDANGNPIEFDVTKITDPDQREAVIQAVWRGTRQIIQGTFIGERGKWAHDNLLKLMTQFRTFSLTAMEKQSSRQYLLGGGGAAGAARVMALFAGAASIAVPIYALRTLTASIGREDQDEYLEQRLAPEAIGRAVFNYIGVAGLSGDLLDVGVGITAPATGLSTTGGRAGVETDFVGNFVAPSLTLVDDAWKMAQGVLDPTDNTLEDVAKLMPGSRMPGALQLLNTMRD